MNRAESSYLVTRAKYIAMPAISLLRPRKDEKRPEISMASRLNRKIHQVPPFNSELSIADEVFEVINQRPVRLDSGPYWIKGRKYSRAEVFASMVDFLDNHNSPLPETVLPPEKHVKRFIDFVLTSKRKLTISEQLSELLEISDGNIAGAANIGALGSRILARGWDFRAYPNIEVNADTIRQTNDHIAPFEDSIDGPGDTYYFWTHFFSTMVYSQLGDSISVAMDKLFSVGTPIMRFVRHYVAGQPTICKSDEASVLGRNLALSIHAYLTQ